MATISFSNSVQETSLPSKDVSPVQTKMTVKKDQRSSGWGGKAKKTLLIRPDPQRFHEKAHEEQNLINSLRNQKTEITAELQKHFDERSKLLNEKGNALELCKQLEEKIKRLRENVNESVTSMKSTYKKTQDLVSNAKELEQNLKALRTEEAIDRRLEEIETLMMTSTLPLSTEKKLMAEMSLLRTRKTDISQYQTIQAEIESIKTLSLPSLQTSVGEKKKILQEALDEKKIANEKLTVCFGKLREFFDKFQTLRAERDRLTKEIAEAMKRKGIILDELSESFKQYETEMQDQRQARIQKAKDEKFRRNLETEQRNLESQLEALEEEVADPKFKQLEHLIYYIKRLIEDRENTASKRKKNKSSKSLTHDFTVLASFQSVGADYPVCHAELDKTLQTLEALYEAEKIAADKFSDTLEERKKTFELKIQEIQMKIEDFDLKHEFPSSSEGIEGKDEKQSIQITQLDETPQDVQ